MMLSQRRWLIGVWAACCLFAASWSVRAHVGSPHILLEGKAGAYPVRVVVRQPDVVPGLAEITVRVLEGNPSRVTALPMHWNTDKRGAPRADVAVPVIGETNLYTAQLWLMGRGAYAIEVAVEGERGGTLLVPVNSVAYERRPMPVWLGWVTGGLGLMLAAGVVAIAAAALREGTLEAASPITPRRRRLAWVGGILGLGLVLGGVWGGNAWWRLEDDFHQSKVLFRPLQHQISILQTNQTESLVLQLTDSRMKSANWALIPDHGRMVHLFLVGEGVAPAFAHLHPVRSDAKDTFMAVVPPLPAGRYQMFCDLTHEMGMSQTVTNTIILSGSPPSAVLSDPQDSWSKGGAAELQSVQIGPDLKLDLQTDSTLHPGEPAVLRVSVLNGSGQPVALEPYLNMLGHAVVLKGDRSVFSHVHPSGTLSMAAARKFARKLGGEAAAKTSDAVCGDLAAMPETEALALGRSGQVRFPYVFPKSGDYLVWVQVKVQGQIVTGLFRLPVPGV